MYNDKTIDKSCKYVLYNNIIIHTFKHWLKNYVQTKSEAKSRNLKLLQIGIVMSFWQFLAFFE